MDLQIYYRKIKEIEEGLRDPAVVVESLGTPDGGKPGIRTEVPRRIAAKMVVEGSARLGTAEEAAEFQEQKAEAKRRVDQAAAAGRLQFTVLSPNELRKLRGGAPASKD